MRALFPPRQPVRPEPDELGREIRAIDEGVGVVLVQILQQVLWHRREAGRLVGIDEDTGPVDVEGVRIRRIHGLHQLDARITADREVLVIVCGGREEHVRAGEGRPIMPPDVGTELPGRIHAAVRVNGPGPPLDRDLLGHELGIERARIRLDHQEIVGDPLTDGGATRPAARARHHERRRLTEHADGQNLGRVSLRLRRAARAR